MNRLLPALPSEQLYPEDAVYMARTNLFETRMLGFAELQLDTVSSLLMGLLNGRSTVRHAGAVSSVAIDLFARAGIEVNEDCHTYQTEGEARSCAMRLVEKGSKLFTVYPLPKGDYRDSSQLVSPKLYRELNEKQNLVKWVPSQNLASQKKISSEVLASLDYTEAICLKPSGVAATGWGYAVFPCMDEPSFADAQKWFMDRKDDIPSVLVEDWIDVQSCWCVGLAVSEVETRCFGGAEQLFSSPCKQSGSMVDSNQPFPDKGASLAIRIGEKARKAGFRGVAGIDIGLSVDGRFIVFDPNFRAASSTSQLLFHQSAAKRIGMAVSKSFGIRPRGKLKDIAQKLHRPIAEGWFVPTRIFDAEKHPLCMGKHFVTGFVLGSDRKMVVQNSRKLRKMVLN